MVGDSQADIFITRPTLAHLEGMVTGSVGLDRLAGLAERPGFSEQVPGI
jgi:hypothetical protein